MTGDVTELAGNLIVEDGEILLLYRKDQKHWEVPGGKVEDGENPTEAATREAREGIGVDVELQKPFYSGEFQHDASFSEKDARTGSESEACDDKIFLWHAYIAEIVDGDPKIKEEEKFGKLEWFEGSELDELELAPNLEMILPALRRL